MIDWRVFDFLRSLADDTDQLARLRTLPKSGVLSAAAAAGYTFTEAEFDDTLWQTEIALAARIGEPFDFDCSMWETMWGKHYLEYLVRNVAAVVRPEFMQMASD